VNKLEEEIAWANAEKLKVFVALQQGWGLCPQWPDKCGDTSKGYEFSVTFSPSAD